MSVRKATDIKDFDGRGCYRTIRSNGFDSIQGAIPSASAVMKNCNFALVLYAKALMRLAGASCC